MIRAKDKATFNRLNLGFSRGVFEASNGAGQWSKLKSEEQEYAREAYTVNDVDMSDDGFSEEEEEEEREVAAELSASEPESDEEEFESDSGESDSGNVQVQSKAKNSALAVGYKEGLSFVVRGDMIGVFKSENQGGKKLKFMANIAGLRTPDGKRSLDPAKVRCLHEHFA